MQQEIEYCHWCEAPISKTVGSPFWLDEDGTALCIFHPVNWNPATMKSTNEHAQHQTLAEVHEIIKQDYYRKQALRRKMPLRAVEDSAVMIRKEPQRTSAAAAERILPNTGTIRRRVYDAIARAGINGMTDEELEKYMNGKHQTISSSRRSLVIDGWIYDSGKTRRNSSNNECIVWYAKTKQEEGMLGYHA